jgi:uncharacterized peroxidase-related enzyme
MSWISTPDETGNAAVAAAYDRDRDALGYVANYTKVFAHRPDVLAAWQGLNASIKASMEPRTYELATLAAALRLRSSYCSLAHGAVLADRHLGSGVMPDVVADPASSGLTPVEVAVMRLADKVAAGAAEMSADDLQELRNLGLDDAALLDVVLAAAARCFFSSVLDAVGAQPDAAYRRLDGPVREALTIGRPIESET